jgi:hypothetical protein
LKYTPKTLGYKVEEKLHLRLHEKKRFDATALEYRTIGRAQKAGDHEICFHPFFKMVGITAMTTSTNFWYYSREIL